MSALPIEGRKLHVSNLSRNIRNPHLLEIFRTYGKVKSASLAMDWRLNLSRGFAFVEYEMAKDAEKAVIAMNEGQIDGNVVRVSYAKNENRGRRSASPGRHHYREWGMGSRDHAQGVMDRSRSRSPYSNRVPQGGAYDERDRGRTFDNRRGRSPLGYRGGRERGPEGGMSRASPPRGRSGRCARDRSPSASIDRRPRRSFSRSGSRSHSYSRGRSYSRSRSRSPHVSRSRSRSPHVSRGRAPEL